MPTIDHVNVQARDMPAMIAFFQTVLGAEEGFRPPFPHPGHWLYLDGQPVLHLDFPARDDDFPQGLINHIAFGIYDLEPLRQRIEAAGYPHDYAGIPGGVGQIFVRGPEGIRIEVQYHR